MQHLVFVVDDGVPALDHDIVVVLRTAAIAHDVVVAKVRVRNNPCIQRDLHTSNYTKGFGTRSYAGRFQDSTRLVSKEVASLLLLPGKRSMP